MAPRPTLSPLLAFAREYYATFQSALDMVGRMYDDLDLDVGYRESKQGGS